MSDHSWSNSKEKPVVWTCGRCGSRVVSSSPPDRHGAHVGMWVGGGTIHVRTDVPWDCDESKCKDVIES